MPADLTMSALGPVVNLRPCMGEPRAFAAKRRELTSVFRHSSHWELASVTISFGISASASTSTELALSGFFGVTGKTSDGENRGEQHRSTEPNLVVGK